MIKNHNKTLDKSVGKNALLNVLRTLLSIVFPLITFPYVSRVLEVQNLGKVNYAASIVSYYALVAALGISTYAIREGARFREDKDRIGKFTNQVFSINIITTAISYIVLLLSFIFVAKLRDYNLLIAIESISIFFTTIGVDWLNVIYEDYAYITLRSFVVQAISLVSMFVFVHNANDYYVYAFITVASQGVISFLNIFHVRKYCKIKLTRNLELCQHIKSILIFFSNNLAVAIYINSDMTMLGWISGNYYTGLYSVAVKIYSIINQLLAAVYNVVIARMSYYYANTSIDQFKKLLNNVINLIVILSIPATIGMMCVAKEVITSISGKEYIGATKALQILSVAFFFAIMGGMFSSCINLPLRREKINLIATSISAVVNIVLNIFLIPIYKQNGAALTTLISEIIVSSILFISLHDKFYLFSFKEIIINITKCLLSASSIVILSIFLKRYLFQSGGRYLMLEIIGSAFLYFTINSLLKNRWITEARDAFLSRIKR